MSDTIDTKQLKELIDSFIEYRKVLAPLQESLRSVGEAYESIKNDLEQLSRNFNGNVAAQLDRVNSTLNSQAKSGQELIKKVDEYAASGERYAQAVNEMVKKFAEVGKRVEAVSEIERGAESLIARLDEIIAEKRASYNLKDLQRALDSYNKNVEKISEYINKDVAEVVQRNADKIEAIRRDNEQLSLAVSEQGKSIAELCTTYAATSALLKKSVESGSVNEQYLYDAFDKWAADRKVKIKKK